MAKTPVQLPPEPPTYAEIKAAVEELAKAGAQVLVFEQAPEQLEVFVEQATAAQAHLDQLIARLPGVKQ